MICPNSGAFLAWLGEQKMPTRSPKAVPRKFPNSVSQLRGIITNGHLAAEPQKDISSYNRWFSRAICWFQGGYITQLVWKSLSLLIYKSFFPTNYHQREYHSSRPCTLHCPSSNQGGKHCNDRLSERGARSPRVWKTPMIWRIPICGEEVGPSLTMERPKIASFMQFFWNIFRAASLLPFESFELGSSYQVRWIRNFTLHKSSVRYWQHLGKNRCTHNPSS